MTKYRPEIITAYFDEFGLAEWERLTRSPTDEIKLAVHTHYLHTYVPRGSRVLEIGAGPGRFTQVLAGLDCGVVVADISPVQLDLNRRFAGELGFGTAVEAWVEADVCRMPMFDDESFDVVVAYGGPLSYALDRRSEAVAECVRLTRRGGLILASVMSLWGTVHSYLPGVLDIAPEQNARIIESGDIVPETLPESRHHCHMFRAVELRRLLEQHDLHVTALAASNTLSTNWGDKLADIRQSPAQWNELLRMEIEASREEGCIDMGTHIIAVAEKG